MEVVSFARGVNTIPNLYNVANGGVPYSASDSALYRVSIYIAVSANAVGTSAVDVTYSNSVVAGAGAAISLGTINWNTDNKFQGSAFVWATAGGGPGIAFATAPPVGAQFTAYAIIEKANAPGSVIN